MLTREIKLRAMTEDAPSSLIQSARWQTTDENKVPSANSQAIVYGSVQSVWVIATAAISWQVPLTD